MSFRAYMLYLVPAGLIGLVFAALLLLLSRRKEGVRPPYARVCRPLAFGLIGFGAVTLILIPLIRFVILAVRFFLTLLYAGLKSL